jgi:dynein light intermediate chain
VKYDTPILVSTSAGSKKMSSTASSMPSVKAQPSQQRAEDYLNSILPPKEYTENGKLWVRYVSPTPATKVDVLNLKIMLDKRLESGAARDVGICPIRENLFQQCFDEVIR